MPSHVLVSKFTKEGTPLPRGRQGGSNTPEPWGGHLKQCERACTQPPPIQHFWPVIPSAASEVQLALDIRFSPFQHPTVQVHL